MKKITNIQLEIQLFAALIPGATDQFEPSTPKFWALKAMDAMQRLLVFPLSCSRDVENQTNIAAMGDTAKVSVIRNFGDAANFNGTFSSTAKKAENVDVKLNQMPYIQFDIKEADLKANAYNMVSPFIKSAVHSVAKYANKYIADLCLKFPNVVGTAGTTPSSLEDIANLKIAMDKYEIEDANRTLILNSNAEAKFLTLDALASANRNLQGNAVLRQGSLGTLYSFEDILASNYTPSYTTIADVTGIAVNLTAGYDVGVSTIAIDDTASALAVAPVAGMTFTFANHSQKYVVLSATTTSITFNPALQAAVVNDESITFYEAANKVVQNSIGLHKSAIAFASRPFKDSGDLLGTSAYTMIYNGLAITVFMYYEPSTMTYKIAVGILFGAEVVDWKAGARLLG